MITSIKEWKIFNENILVPRNLDSRKEKLRQDIIKLLSQEVIEGKLIIDKTFEEIDNNLIKVKRINGDVYLDIKKSYIPSWLKNVIINGNFICSFNNLKSLENCPQYISGYFNCAFNNLKNLKFGPNHVGRSYSCTYNKLTSLEGCPKYINIMFDCSYNKLKSLDKGPLKVDGNYICKDNIGELQKPKDIEINGTFEG